MRVDMKFDDAAIRSSLNKAVLLLSQANMKKLFYAIGVAIQVDTKANFKNDSTYDGERMPALAASTWIAKNMGWGKYGRDKKKGKGRANKTPEKLYNFGTLQKIDIAAKPTEVVVYSIGDGYPLFLNDRKVRPFKFMGFGKKLLLKIDETIWKKIWELMFK